MSWPSFYGYKYTPIGLRQSDAKDEFGSKTVSTKVHLPEGGHLLDIERRYNPDGSVSKTESANNAPMAGSPFSVPTSMTPRAATEPLFAEPLFSDENKPNPPLSEFERHADDIIANFKARQSSGMDQARREMSRLMGENV